MSEMSYVSFHIARAIRTMCSSLLMFSRRWISKLPIAGGNLTQSIRDAEQWVSNLNVDSVPLKMFSVRYDRSSGPGGQNVNKVNSKCTLVLYNFSSCSWVPELVRRQLKEKGMRYYAEGSDSLVVQSDEARSRDLNRRTCLAKLVKEIKSICWFPKETSEETLKKWNLIKTRADQTRIQQKKHHSDKKKSRGKGSFTY